VAAGLDRIRLWPAKGFIEDPPEEEAVTGFQSRITRGAAQKLGETT